MTDPTATETHETDADGAEHRRVAEPTVARGVLVDPPSPAANEAVEEERREAVEEPAKVMRIGSMIKQLLDEVRTSQLDERARGRLREIYDISAKELGEALSPDLRVELDRVAIPFGGDDNPTESEIRIAQAQLVGWLEGLFHGIQATLFAQQMAARSQVEGMRNQLPDHIGGAQSDGSGRGDDGGARPGVYL